MEREMLESRVSDLEDETSTLQQQLCTLRTETANLTESASQQKLRALENERLVLIAENKQLEALAEQQRAVQQRMREDYSASVKERVGVEARAEAAEREAAAWKARAAEAEADARKGDKSVSEALVKNLRWEVQSLKATVILDQERVDQLQDALLAKDSLTQKCTYFAVSSCAVTIIIV